MRFCSALVPLICEQCNRTHRSEWSVGRAFGSDSEAHVSQLVLPAGQWQSVSAGAQFTCFTGAKVQILTQRVGRGREVELLWALASGGEGGGGGGGCGGKVGGVARAGRALIEPSWSLNGALMEP